MTTLEETTKPIATEETPAHTVASTPPVGDNAAPDADGTSGNGLTWAKLAVKPVEDQPAPVDPTTPDAVTAAKGELEGNGVCWQ